MTPFHLWVANTIAELGGDYSGPIESEPAASPLRPDYTTYTKAYICGVYFLMMNDETMYVGQSKNVYSRIAQHMNNADFEFDHFVITECEPVHLLQLEAKFIHEMHPKWNKEIPAFGDKKHSRNHVRSP